MKAPTYDEAIGHALRRARKNAGLTQDQLAARIRRRHLNILQPMLSRYEHGTVQVPNHLVQLVERELGLAPGTIYGEAFGLDWTSRTTWNADMPADLRLRLLRTGAEDILCRAA